MTWYAACHCRHPGPARRCHDESLFAAAMDAVVQELDSKHFTVEYEGATLSLETSDIYYLESHGHKVLIHCKGQDLTLRMTIPEALEQLPKRCFASPHKSYLVNMEHIIYATGTMDVLSSGNQLPISRRKRQEFNQSFNAYLCGTYPLAAGRQTAGSHWRRFSWSPRRQKGLTVPAPASPSR